MSSKIRILYVDDYELDRELVKDVLEKEHGGFEVSEASSKREFESLLARREFDLVLSDFNIAGFEGLQVLETVKAFDRRIPVIIVTGTGSEEIAVKALQQGASDYVIKRPKHIQKLPQTIFAALEKCRLNEQRRKAEEALKASEERFRGIAENSLVGIYVLQDGVFVYVNPKFAEIFGYSVDECLQAMPLRQIVHPQDRDAVLERVGQQESGETGRTHFAFRGLRKNGEVADIEVFASSIRVDGSVALTGTLLDITARNRTEAELRHQGELLERIMETSPAAIVRTDAAGRIAYFNKRAEDLLGIDSSILADRTYDDPEWKITDFQGNPFPEERLPFAVVQRTHAPVFNIQHAIERSDAGRVLLSINAAPLLDGKGRFDGVVAAFDDVTEKFKAEQNYQMLFREMLDGFALHEIICDERGAAIDYRFLAVNPAFERLTGFKSEEITGKTVREVMPEIESDWIDKYGKVAISGDPICFERYSRELKRYFKVTAFRPTPNRFACIFVDVTELKNSEMALRAAHERFLTVLDSIDATVYVADLKTHEILFMNRCMINEFGRDMTGEVCWKVFRAQSGPCPHCNNDRLVDADGRPTGVHVWQGKNPVSGKWYINYDRAIEWTDGRWVRIQIATDITPLKSIETQLRQAQKMEAIGNLAGGIAHEFNNVLAIIIGNIELAVDALDANHPVAENLREVQAASLRGKEVVRQLLSFSRKSDVRQEPIDLKAIVKETVGLLRASIPSAVRLVESLSEPIDTVVADPTQLSQLLINLCNNAAHAMSDNGGTLTIDVRNVVIDERAGTDNIDLKPGRFVRIRVSDTGIGIPKELHEKIFDPFFTTKPLGQGTGMGLAVVHGIAKAFGGAIEVQSTVGAGTTFDVFFPARQDAPPPAKTQEKLAPQGVERILVVDDEPQLVNLYQKILSRLNYRVFTENDPLRALERFRSDPSAFDLIVTDMSMPQLRGDRLAREMLKIRADVPIVLCTGYNDSLSAEAAIRMGIQRVLLKPLESAELADAVRQVLDGASRRSH